MHNQNPDSSLIPGSFALPATWSKARALLGWSCIGLGILGLILPIIPGIPLLIAGTALVGRRHPTLRRAIVHLRLSLRGWAKTRLPLVGHSGRLARRAYRQFVRQMHSQPADTRSSPTG